MWCEAKGRRLATGGDGGYAGYRRTRRAIHTALQGSFWPGRTVTERRGVV